MIVKYNNNLYNLDGWKKISQEDGWCTISFAKTVKVEDGDYEDYELTFELIDEDYLFDFQREHEDYDHKDIRQVRYRADNIVYKTLVDKIHDNTMFIDLDIVLDIPDVLKEANEDYEKEWKDADDNTD